MIAFSPDVGPGLQRAGQALVPAAPVPDITETAGEADAPGIDADAVARDLGPDGSIAATLGAGSLGADGLGAATATGYEDRASQRAMAWAVADLYSRGGVGLFEAGTGVGKSLAYLVPALRWAAATGERTVVSTNTINLQEQLVGKDLPLLAAALPEQPVRFALLKGWRNYLCLYRLEHAAAAESLFDPDAAREVAAIGAWAGRTEDGSLADLPRPPRPEVWDEVAAEPDLCLRQQCPHLDDCFLFRARRVAAQADVVVVNHHLLMSDIAVRRLQQNWHDAAVIPPYARLVVDEGHHLEDAAAAHLGASVTRRGWQRLFARLERRGGKGLLAQLAHTLGAMDDLLAAATVDLVRGQLIPAIVETRDRGELVFDLLATLLAADGPSQLRLTEGFAHHPVWAGGLSLGLEEVMRGAGAVEDAFRLIQGRHGGDTIQQDALGRILAELRGVGRRLTAAADTLRLALAPATGSDPAIRWVELRRGARERERSSRESGAPPSNVAVCVVPLDLAPILRDDLFSRVDTAIVTSATLAADGRFEYLASRLGVGTVDGVDAAVRTGLFPSPFDYARQALLAIPTDVPAPNVDGCGHADAVIRVVRDVARASQGGMFVLFTSHRDVRAAAAALRADGSATSAGDHWARAGGSRPPRHRVAQVLGAPLPELLVQGEEPRDVLLRRFRASGHAVLLGTASFWEGVDVPGSALRALVIARLPFRVPTEPVTAAQCEAIAARGGDPFADYMLPQASLRLKQGFGRLIRSASDRGVVVLTDPRVVTKTYGRQLLDALPPARRVAARWVVLRRQIEAFYHSDGDRA